MNVLYVPRSDYLAARTRGAWHERRLYGKELCVNNTQLCTAVFRWWRDKSRWRPPFAVHVRYDERDQAKRCGCYWDAESRKWMYHTALPDELLPKWVLARIANKRYELRGLPFEERHAAKAAGAAWDRVKKVWCFGIEPSGLSPALAARLVSVQL